MALIKCTQCGKNISDSVETCIHCGAPTKKAAANEVKVVREQAKVEKEQKSYAKEAVSPRKNFNMFADVDRQYLEAEFVKGDPWAYKYRRSCIEFGSFIRLFLFPLLGLFVFFNLLRVINFDLLSGPTVNEGYNKLFLGCLIALVVFCVLSLVFAIFIRIRSKTLYSKLKYMKKFQKWLDEKKNIDYDPPLVKASERAMLERINV